MMSNNEPLITVFEDSVWAENTAKIFAEEVKSRCLLQKVCRIVLTGGRAASLLYKEWFPLIANISNQIFFYFGDERCVSPDSIDSNFYSVIRCLPNNFNQRNIYRIYGETLNYENECCRYSDLLPSKLDFILLSIGDDAHIASIFPMFNDIVYTERVIFTESPNHPHKRITIAKSVLDSADKVICLAKGKNKGIAMTSIFTKGANEKDFPAVFVKSAHWFLDSSAYSSFKK